MRYVLFPIAHGVEIKPVAQNYASPLIDKIKKYLTEEERGYFVPLPYNYSIKTDPRQMKMSQAVEAGLGNQELRRLKHIVGSDVTWSFIIAKDGKECFYTDFVNDLKSLIDGALSKYPGAEVACLGHSQGTQLLYSFFFDYGKPIDGFFAMGSPISMNSGAYPNWGKLPPRLGFWFNFYNDMDFISSKIQNVHPSKEIADFVVDYQVPLGWNPLYHLPQRFFKVQLVAGLLSHIAYWKSDYVAKIIAEKISKLIQKT